MEWEDLGRMFLQRVILSNHPTPKSFHSPLSLSLLLLDSTNVTRLWEYKRKKTNQKKFRGMGGVGKRHPFHKTSSSACLISLSLSLSNVCVGTKIKYCVWTNGNCFCYWIWTHRHFFNTENALRLNLLAPRDKKDTLESWNHEIQDSNKERVGGWKKYGNWSKQFRYDAF